MNKDETPVIINSKPSDTQIIELKCEVCGKKCGQIEYPKGVVVDEKKVLDEHRTRCDEHPLQAN